MRVGIIGTGAIAHKHAQAYANIGFRITACTNATPERGRSFAEKYGAAFVPDYEDLCRRPDVDFVDVCTFPDFRLQPLRACAEAGKHIQVQKPISTSLDIGREIVDVARNAGIVLGVVSQHRFDDSSIFLKKAIEHGRLGRLIQCDAYVKWFRSAEYYRRPLKGSWAVEGGGALINQAIHQIDLLRWLAGPVDQVSAMWQLGALHRIQSEDVVNALFRYSNGATGVLQASTAIWPGYPERLEIHGTCGSAIVTGDKLTAWDIQGDHQGDHQGDDEGDAPPLAQQSASGASDPMAISLEPFERQFLDFADAIANKRKPLVAGEEGCDALEIVERIYTACRTT
jgi:predicted dehydrogenase